MSELEPTLTYSNPTATDELKPCPFCGAEAFVRCRMNKYWVSACHDSSCVLCDEMFGYPPIVFGSEAGAVKAWNRRADHD